MERTGKSFYLNLLLFNLVLSLCFFTFGTSTVLSNIILVGGTIFLSVYSFIQWTKDPHQLGFLLVNMLSFVGLSGGIVVLAFTDSIMLGSILILTGILSVITTSILSFGSFLYEIMG